MSSGYSLKITALNHTNINISGRFTCEAVKTSENMVLPGLTTPTVPPKDPVAVAHLADSALPNHCLLRQTLP
jgi:hypothetical protein